MLITSIVAFIVLRKFNIVVSEDAEEAETRATIEDSVEENENENYYSPENYVLLKRTGKTE